MPKPLYPANFVAIIQAGSIGATTDKLGCGRSVVSRQLARLKHDLRARPVQRSTRSRNTINRR